MGLIIDRDLQEIFAANLNRIAAEQGMSQTDIARKIGVTNAAVSYWFNGQKMPRNSLIDALADVLGCSRFDLTLPKDFHRKPLNDAEWDLIETFRRSDEDTKKMVIRLLEYAKIEEGKDAESKEA